MQIPEDELLALPQTAVPKFRHVPEVQNRGSSSPPELRISTDAPSQRWQHFRPLVPSLTFATGDADGMDILLNSQQHCYSKWMNYKQQATLSLFLTDIRAQNTK